MKPEYLTSLTALSTGTVLTLVSGTPGAGRRLLIHGAIGGGLTSGGTWQLKDGSTVIHQGFFLAGADGGLVIGGNKGIPITPATAASLVVTPTNSTVLSGNLAVSEEGPGE